MIKRVTLIRRKDGIDDAEFERRWLVHHAEMMKSLPHVARYVQNRTPDGAQWGGQPLDGIVEMWFEDDAAMSGAFSSQVWAEIVADARDFLGTMQAFVVKETTVVS